MSWRESSGANPPDVPKALVQERRHLRIRVVGATCRFGKFAHPVSLDPLEVSARLCDAAQKEFLNVSPLPQMKKQGDGVSTNSASLSDSQSLREHSHPLQSS